MLEYLVVTVDMIVWEVDNPNFPRTCTVPFLDIDGCEDAILFNEDNTAVIDADILGDYMADFLMNEYGGDVVSCNIAKVENTNTSECLERMSSNA